MMQLITRNFGWKVLSVAAAFAVWVNETSDPDLATIVSVPVVYNNYPKDLLITSESAAEIRIEARGPATQIRALPASNTAAVIDLSSVSGPGERTFTLSGAELKLPRGLALVRTVPTQLRFTFERKASRTLPVEVPFSGTLPDGISIVHQTVSPTELAVTGPESHVLDAVSLVADTLDLSTVRGDGDRTLTVYSPDPELRISGTSKVRVRLVVKKSR